VSDIVSLKHLQGRYVIITKSLNSICNIQWELKSLYRRPRDFSSVRLATPGVTYPQRCFREPIGRGVTPLFRIQEVPASNLGRDNGYPDLAFRVSSQFTQANDGILRQIRPPALPSKCILIPYSVIILATDAMRFAMLTAPLNDLSINK
jgi:hypothetical protein